MVVTTFNDLMNDVGVLSGPGVGQLEATLEPMRPLDTKAFARREGPCRPGPCAEHRARPARARLEAPQCFQACTNGAKVGHMGEGHVD